jgi:hypothetical protein
MKKILFIIGLFTILLCGCGDNASGPDTKPPQIKNSSPEILSVTDTLEITFNEDIDTSDLNLDTLRGSFGATFISKNKLLIFGTDSSSGIRHFAFNTEVEFSFLDLKDMKGNTNEDIEPLSLNFYPWFDRDALEQNFDYADTLRGPLDLGSWKDGTPLSEALVSEGVLQPKYTNDIFDYKVLALKPLDTLSISLQCPETGNMSLVFYGPFEMEGFEADFINVKEPVAKDNPLYIASGVCQSSRTKTVLDDHVMDFEHHTQNRVTATELFYVIEVSSVGSRDYGFYRLSTTLSPRKISN